jgi:hypothetical protein
VDCAYLSPPHLLQEMEEFFSESEVENLVSHEFRTEHPSLFWNLIWHFSNLRLPTGAVAPWLDDHNRRSKARKGSFSVSKTARN